MTDQENMQDRPTENVQDNLIIPADPGSDQAILQPTVGELAHSGYIAVVGKPNVGKSTLMNRILGEKLAAVSPKPQTTRLTQLGIFTVVDTQAIFVDTPGIHEPRHRLGAFMVKVATDALRDADVILFVADVSAPPDDEDKHVASLIRDSQSGSPVVIALNKLDATSPEYVMPNTESFRALVSPDSEWEAISARNGQGVDELLARVVGKLPPGPQYFPPDQLSDRNMRQIAAETIREKVMHNTEKEVPHAIAVEILEYKERNAHNTYIRAAIYVERDTQKQILIGRSGSMVKRISTEAREELEKQTATKVFLELEIKVEKDWRTNERFLQRLGFRLREE